MKRLVVLSVLALACLQLAARAEEPLRRFLYAATPDGAQPETALELIRGLSTSNAP